MAEPRKKITRKRLKELQVMVNAATPGEWMAGHLSDESHSCKCRYVLCDRYMGSIATVNFSESRDLAEGDNPPLHEAKANQRFLAEARSVVPELIAEIKRLRGWA